jgi:hypothetical protein
MEFIFSFIAITMMFTLFYFNAPFWCGKGMYKTSRSGIWKLYYILLSTMGHLLYRLCEMLSKLFERLIFKRLKLNKNKSYPTLSILINLLTYIGVIFLLSKGYTKLCDSFTINSNADVNTLVGGDKNIFEYIKKKVSFVRIVVELYTGYSYSLENRITIGFVSVIFVIIMWAILIFINTVYFSVLYGLLKEKLIEVERLHFFNNFKKWNQDNRENNNMDKHSFSSLMIQIKTSISDWIKSQTIINNLLNIKVMLAFIPLLFVFSLFMYLTEIYKPNVLSTLFQILDSMNLIGIIISFGITWMGTRGVQLGGAYVISKTPSSMQDWFEKVSTRAGVKAEEYESKRHQWAEDNDTVQNAGKTVNNNTSYDTKFNNEAEARAFLIAEFRKKGIVSDDEIEKKVDRILDDIPPSRLKEMHLFTKPNKFIDAANFYKRHPEIYD